MQNDPPRYIPDLTSSDSARPIFAPEPHHVPVVINCQQGGTVDNSYRQFPSSFSYEPVSSRSSRMVELPKSSSQGFELTRDPEKGGFFPIGENASPVHEINRSPNYDFNQDNQPMDGQENLPGSIVTKKDGEEGDKSDDAKPVTGRETWDSKIDFLLAVIGFAVDLGNIWRFPYICFSNGGGAFLIPYLVMYIFGGLPLFYLELSLGQFQRSGCITVWKRICPLFSGIGFAICIIASYTSWYYNTIISWAVFYLFDSMRSEVPWASCGNRWNTNNCITVSSQLKANPDLVDDNATTILTNKSAAVNVSLPLRFSSTEEYFYRHVLQLQYASGYNGVGTIRWEIALCLVAVFTLVYFSLWKGVKSSGKAVWVTATLPYIILTILLIRGLTLPGSWKGIKFYITPRLNELLQFKVWNDAATQIFFSLGPGFGVLLALSSYNKFRNNCFQDAMLTSCINCATSFMSGFVVFSVLGHMCWKMGKDIQKVASEGFGKLEKMKQNFDSSLASGTIMEFLKTERGQRKLIFEGYSHTVNKTNGTRVNWRCTNRSACNAGPGLVFIAYPEAIATLKGSVVWAIIFMLMLITLGLDSTFGGLEAAITAIVDLFPKLRQRRELVVLFVIIYCYVGALPTTTNGGYLILDIYDRYAVPISILFIVFCECVALCWFYGINRFCRDVESMLGFRPGPFWRICWTFISPLFLLILFIANVVLSEQPKVVVMGKHYPVPLWFNILRWLLVVIPVTFIPAAMIIRLALGRGTFVERIQSLIQPEPRPEYLNQGRFPDVKDIQMIPILPQPEEEEPGGSKAS